MVWNEKSIETSSKSKTKESFDSEKHYNTNFSFYPIKLEQMLYCSFFEATNRILCCSLEYYCTKKSSEELDKAIMFVTKGLSVLKVIYS